MRVLITGSQGKVGQVVTRAVLSEGHEVRSLDVAASPPVAWEHIPADILDPIQMRRAVMGVDSIIHLAAIPNDRWRESDRVFQINVQGTWNVLQAAAECGVKKVVFFSSVNALGIWGGRRMPDYLPIDDAHPHYPAPAYGLSKHLGEEMCESFTRRYGFSTYCLRPAFVLGESDRGWWMRRDAAQMRSHMVGDYYSYTDVRDVAQACVLCLRENAVQHGRYLLVADRNAAGVDTEQLAREDYPEVPWKAGPDYLDHPHKALVDTSAAFRDLGWKAQYHLDTEDWGDNT